MSQQKQSPAYFNGRGSNIKTSRVPPTVHTEEAGGLLEAKHGPLLREFRNVSQAALVGRGIHSRAEKKDRELWVHAEY